MKGIRFKKAWRGRVPGQVETGFDYGLAATLVTRGVAEWLANTADGDGGGASGGSAASGSTPTPGLGPTPPPAQAPAPLHKPKAHRRG